MPKRRRIAQTRKSARLAKGKAGRRSSGKSGAVKRKISASSEAAKKSTRKHSLQRAVDAVAVAAAGAVAADAVVGAARAVAAAVGAAVTHDHSDTVDFALLDEMVAEIRKHRAAGLNIVERCGALGLPLVLDGDKKAFHAALAELEMLYDKPNDPQHQNDLKLVLEAVYGRTTIYSEFRPDLDAKADDRSRRRGRPSRKGKLSLRLKTTYQSIAREHIVGLVYPWYNKFLYRTVQRITDPRGLDVERYRHLNGDYRYFRSYPGPEAGEFTIRDGYLELKFDERNNMLCFGHRSASHDKLGHEHRGLVFPREDTGGKNFYDLLSFRGGKMRMTSISGYIRELSDGIVLSATRNSPFRPFAARFLMVKSDSQNSGDLYGLQMPGADENPALNEPYQKLLAEFRKLVARTTLSDYGYMWGSEPN